MNASISRVSVLASAGFLAGTAAAVSIETVQEGNVGNAPDRRYGGYGSVGYTYNTGKYEVTAGQYTEFLNAVAKTDTYGAVQPEHEVEQLRVQDRAQRLFGQLRL